MVEKKQLLIILPFWGYFSFETRNRLNSCIRNQLPSCSLSIAFQSKTCISTWFKFRDSIPKYLFSNVIYKFWCSCCNTTYYGETERHHARASKHLVITPMTKKRVKNTKKSAIMSHILLQGHNATYNDFLNLTPDINQFKLHMKKSLLIGRDKPELNSNI